MENFKTISPLEIEGNFINLIANGWMLITAGDKQRYNTMTASWGGVGELWGKHVATLFIRPQRYTKEFVDMHDTLTLSFFDEGYRKALSWCGSHSGRDGDKITQAGLHVCFTPDGTPALAEARMIIEGAKLYADELRPERFLHKEEIEKWYPQKDYHTFYICEIKNVYIKLHN